MADKTTPPTKKSKKFSIAREGDTTDGRVIERAWIEQMAEGYNTATYAARINLEHIKGVTPMPDSPFGAYGTVVSLSTEERDGNARRFVLAHLWRHGGLCRTDSCAEQEPPAFRRFLSP